MARQDNRRKTKVVLREMQSRILLHTAAFPLAALGLLTLVVGILTNRVIAEAAQSEQALSHLELLLAALVLLTSCMAGAILFVAFRFSHRVAGPTYRIVESLKRIRAGDLDFKVKLRNGDFLTEIADELNAAVDELRDGSLAAKPPLHAPDPAPAMADSAG